MLNLDDNRLVSLKSLTTVPRLQKFSANRNRLTKIRKSMFRGLRYLKEVSLTSNKLWSITYQAFATLNNLRILNLSNNKLETIGKLSDGKCGLSSINRLQRLILEDNPINCNCSMLWIKKLTNRRADVIGLCRKPKAADGHSLSRMQFSCPKRIHRLCI